MRRSLFAFFVLIISNNNLLAQLIVNDSVAAPILANHISGGGVSISNITNTPNDSLTMGDFTCSGNCNIGISSGIILTSGFSSVAAQTNTGTGQGAAVGIYNYIDPDLSTLVGGGTTLNDVCILEFDFVAVSDTVRFNYVFASEEYSDYVNSAFNDVFGFFVSGPGIAGNQNIALVPGANIPIAINNVNNGNSLPGTPPTGPCNNCAYFLDNTLNNYTTAYDGLTTVLTATAAGIQPGQTYHLKLAIADVADQVFDSGVFLEAGSFLAAGPVAMYVDGSRLASNTVQLCAGSSVSLSAPAGFTYQWNTGATTQSISVSAAGSYSVTITGSNSNFTVNSPTISFIVNPNTIPTPALSQNGNTILSSVNQSNYNYSWTLNGSVIPNENNPALNFNQTGCYSIIIQDSATGCAITSDTLCVTPTGVTGIANNDLTVQVFPNPADLLLNLNYDLENRSSIVFKIQTLTGEVVLNKILPAHSSAMTMDISQLANGFYIYSFENKDVKIKTGKLSIIRQ